MKKLAFLMMASAAFLFASCASNSSTETKDENADVEMTTDEHEGHDHEGHDHDAETVEETKDTTAAQKMETKKVVTEKTEKKMEKKKEAASGLSGN